MIGFGPTHLVEAPGRDRVRREGDPARRLHRDDRHVPARQGRARCTRTRRGSSADSCRTRATPAWSRSRPATRTAPSTGCPVWKRIVDHVRRPVHEPRARGRAVRRCCSWGSAWRRPSTTVGSVSACALPATSERQTCEPGDPAAPGAAAGIEPGDRIVSVAGQPIDDWNESTAIIRDHPDEPIDLVVVRDGDEVTLVVTPMLSERYVIDENGQVVTDAAGEPVTVAGGLRRHQPRDPRPCSSPSPRCSPPSARTSPGSPGSS